MSEKIEALPRPDAIEADNPQLWATLVTMHEAVATRLFWPNGVSDNVMVLKLSHVRLLLAQPMVNVHVAHHLYWLLMSSNGPNHLVAFTPRAETRLREFFNASSMLFAQKYLDQSRYRRSHNPFDAHFCMNPETKNVIAAVLRALNEESIELPF